MTPRAINYLYRLTHLMAACLAWMFVAQRAAALPSVQFELDSSNGSENLSPAPIHVVLSEPGAKDVEVRFDVIGGTASPVFDYNLTPGVLRIPKGQTAATINIKIIKDGTLEPNETILLELSEPKNATLGSRGRHEYTIIDDGQSSTAAFPKVGFASSSSGAAEDVTSNSVVVELSKASQTAVTVEYRVTGGTATGGGDDYLLEEGTLTFEPAEKQARIQLEIINDDKAEKDETIELELSDPGFADLGEITEHVYTIKDNDPVFVFFAEERSSALESVSEVQFEVKLSAEAQEEVTVEYFLSGDALPEGVDYTLAPGTVTFPPGVTSCQIVAQIKNDEDVESTETLVLNLAAPVNATLGQNREHTHRIIDDDKPLGGIQFEQASSTAAETQTSATLWVEVKNRATTATVKVDYEVSGTSTAGVDHLLESGTLDFDNDGTRRAIVFETIDDFDDEADETIIIKLKDPEGAKLGQTIVHTRWITDDDGPPEQIALFKQNIDTVDPDRFLTLIGPKGPVIIPGGLALDSAGNYYISDKGNGQDGAGAIYLWPAGEKKLLKIVSGLTLPGDLELSPDERALLVALPQGKVRRIPLGISIKLTGDTTGVGAIVFIDTDSGVKQARIGADGWFHFTGVLTAAQKKKTVDVTVEIGGKSRTISGVELGVPGIENGPRGHAVRKLGVPAF